MSVKVKLATLNDADWLAQVLNLTQRLPDKPDSPMDYLNHIIDYGYGLAIFVALDDADKVIGYIHVEAPGWLDDKTGWIVSCVNTAGLSVSRKMLAAAEEWLARTGAKKVQMLTRRKSGAWAKAFGFVPSEFICYEKELEYGQQEQK